MTFARKWNFDGAARLLTTIDLDEIDDPTSDMGAAILTALEGLSITASLPTGGATGTVLKKISGADGDAGWAAITTSDVTGLIAELAGKADVATVSALATTVSGKASQASLDALTATVSGKAAQTSLDATNAAVALKASSASIALLQTQSLADVDATVPGDEMVLMFDSLAGQYSPASLNGLFAEADPSTGQTLPEFAAPNSLFGFIINEGADPPSGLPLGLGLAIIGFERAAPADLTPTLIASNHAAVANNVVLTMPRALDIGEKYTLCIGYSGEATVPDHFSVAWSGGGTADVTFTTKNAPNTTACEVQAEVEITATVPNGGTCTVTSRDVANTAINRTHTMVALVFMPGTADDALDTQKNSPSIASSGTMTVITSGATVADTVMASEVGIGVACWSSGVSPATRVLGGTNGWQKIVEEKSDNGASARSMAVFYQIYTSVQKPNLTTQMVASDGATGTASCQVASYKGL